MTIRLIATDLDGTLLRSDHTLSPRTRRVIDLAAEVGVPVIPTTGRLPVMTDVLTEHGLLGPAIASNGGVAFHVGTREVYFEDPMGVDVQLRVVEALLAVLPDVRFASARRAGEELVYQEGYLEMWHNTGLKASAVRPARDLADLVTEPTIKLMAWLPGMPAEELAAIIDSFGIHECAPTTSGVPFVELQSALVSKATGLARLCGHFGISRHEVIAFGDQRNDLEMLEWAGIGVAMGNAVPEAVAAADIVAPPNDADGLAVLVEQLIEADWQIEAVRS